jgi:hypothetical protein
MVRNTTIVEPEKGRKSSVDGGCSHKRMGWNRQKIARKAQKLMI